MRVFKFGGASIASAKAIRNMGEIVRSQNDGPVVIVVSAMGKMTNHLEDLYQLKTVGNSYHELLERFHSFHREILQDLGLEANILSELLGKLETALERVYTDYNKGYDQVICSGELFSSTIISHYLNLILPEIQLLDARKFIKTDNVHRDAKIDWVNTEKQVSSLFRNQKAQFFVTQGFIGSTSNDITTTLGREGSDFTGAILAHCLNADSLTVWKDVPGILSADPKLIPDASKIDELSYEEAAELTYYGAKVIHPKTIKPLANKGIPLYVRPFLDPKKAGTLISNNHIPKTISSIIFKEAQTLISFTVDDFTFINEKNLTQILHTLTHLNIKINLMQNSAITFSICIDNDPDKIDQLIGKLGNDFSIRYNDGLRLITIKNSNQIVIDEISENREILLEQKTRHNYQIVVKEQEIAPKVEGL